MTTVVFNMNAKTLFGELLFITGNCRALGDWNPDRAFLLRTDDQSFPNWSATVHFDSSSDVEYKYFVRNGEGKIKWEPFQHNRTLKAKPLWMIVDDGVFGVFKGERKEISSMTFDTNNSLLPFITNADEQKIREYQEALEVQESMISDLKSKVDNLQNKVAILEGNHLHSLNIEELQSLSHKCRKVADQASELMMRKVQEQCESSHFSECVTCMDRAIDTIIFPCAHLVVCHECSFKLGGKCPICKQKIETFHKVYMK
eukprot:TRINITY_DN6684_c1_g1_i1.p1 TRINITY_DN6684_c1_g1~~TRINITY_DN6684_c1_g1_i1.p1  ORF type:complete len:258 (+),score=50.76 TRINITY_DN6684_c1_g1_i1:306-1079(+)